MHVVEGVHVVEDEVVVRDGVAHHFNIVTAQMQQLQIPGKLQETALSGL